MKKTLIALAVLGACASAAHAQTNITIYGLVDTGFIKETGSDARMGGNEDSRIGVKGTEDLGSGLKATFQLERRFNLNSGKQIAGNNALDKLQGTDDGESGVAWQGAANVGLSSNTWGALRLGRVNDIAIENYGALDPFIYYGVGSSFGAYNLLYSEELANTVRYDSPSWAGFSFNLSYTLGQDTHHGNGEGIYGNQTGGYDNYGNDGFGIGLKYDNGSLMLTANYDRIADSDKSYLWDIGGAWTWQGFKVSVGYQDTTVERAASCIPVTISQSTRTCDTSYAAASIGGCCFGTIACWIGCPCASISTISPSSESRNRSIVRRLISALAIYPGRIKSRCSLYRSRAVLCSSCNFSVRSTSDGPTNCPSTN